MRGWAALDPANSILIGDDHIVRAKGRGNAGIFLVAGSREENVDAKLDVVPGA